MTEIGYALKVDGTVTARQASRAGEAVVLGSDGLIPANLLPATSGGAKYVYFGPTGGVVEKIAVEGAVESSASSSMQTVKDGSSSLLSGLAMRVRDGLVIMSTGEGAYSWNSAGTLNEFYKIHPKDISTDVLRGIVESLPGVQCIGDFAADYYIYGGRSSKVKVCDGVVRVQGGQATMASCNKDTSSKYIFGNSDGTFRFGFYINWESTRPLDR